jgi:tRNA G18 (ribose-2'-O)-methylase SpoU
MPPRTTLKERKETRKWAERQYVKHYRHNLVHASPGLHDFVIILDNLKPSFNIGKIFRSGDAFGAHSVHLIGTDYFEVKPAKGSFKWLPAHFHKTFDQCYTLLKEEGYTMFVMEPDAIAPLHRMKLPKKSAFIFGHEEYGISFNADDYENIHSLKVPQVGRVESLNVSIAASIVMYEYMRQHSD